jgi:hypothetical protein
MATSNDTRVRVELLAKIIASVRPASGRAASGRRFICCARCRSPRSSVAVKSDSFRKCRVLIVLRVPKSAKPGEETGPARRSGKFGSEW